MKKYAILFFITILFNIDSISQKEMNTEQYSFYNSKAVPVSYDTFNEEMMKQIYESVAVERQKVLSLLDKTYPGLKEQMDKDLQQIGSITDSALIAALYINFEKNYYHKINEVWSIAGIKEESLRKKYSNILGNIVFEITKFGSIIIRRNQEEEPEPPTYPDNFLETGRQDQQWETGGCGLASHYILEGKHGDYPRLSMSAVDAGGCNFSFMRGSKIAVPDKVYKYLVANFRQPFSTLGNRSVSAFGVSCAESTLSIHIEADGVEIIKRDVAQVITVAPIFWIAALSTPIPQYASITIYNPEKLPGKEYKVYRRMHCKVGSGGIFSIATAWNYVMTGEVRLTLIK